MNKDGNRSQGWCLLVDCPRRNELDAVSEDQNRPIPVSVVALRAESCLADGDNVIISLRTKYSTAERKYSVPIECFQDLILDFQRLSASTPSEPPNKASDQAEPCFRLKCR